MTERTAERFLTEVRKRYRDGGADPPVASLSAAFVMIDRQYDGFLHEVRPAMPSCKHIREALVRLAAGCVKAVVDLNLNDE